MFLGFRF